VGASEKVKENSYHQDTASLSIGGRGTCEQILSGKERPRLVSFERGGIKRKREERWRASGAPRPSYTYKRGHREKKSNFRRVGGGTRELGENKFEKNGCVVSGSNKGRRGENRSTIEVPANNHSWGKQDRIAGCGEQGQVI